MKDENVPSEIIGVVGDNKHMGLDTEVEPMAYWPHPELVYSVYDLGDSTKGEPGSVAAGRAPSDSQPRSRASQWEVITMNDLMAKSIARSKFNATLLAVFSLVALVMAAVGIYGVMSYSVQLRTHEIGCAWR
jgi:putative ABC transport system permease protein